MIFDPVTCATAPKPHPTALRSLKRRLGSFRDELPFMLGDGRHDLHRKVVGVRQIDRNKLDAIFLLAGR